MHSSTLMWCASLSSTLAPRHPGYATQHPAPRHPVQHGVRVQSAGRGAVWGSLLAAPVDRPARLVTWSYTRTPITPLIGTPLHSPGVTQPRAITTSKVIYTLLWSTLQRPA